MRAADTIVLTHAQPATSQTSYSVLPGVNQELLEKPSSKEDNLRMLLDLNGAVCEVVTGVTIGTSSTVSSGNVSHSQLGTDIQSRIVYPVLHAPGYSIKSFFFHTNHSVTR